MQLKFEVEGSLRGFAFLSVALGIIFSRFPDIRLYVLHCNSLFAIPMAANVFANIRRPGKDLVALLPCHRVALRSHITP